MIVLFSEIDWDTEIDGENTSVDLPKAVKMLVDNDTDLENEGADVLSDMYGWCVNSFNYNIIN